jgi:deoxyribodipyrimidine photo-lyase
MREYTPLSLTTTFPKTPEISLDPNLPLCLYTDYFLDPEWLNHLSANRVLVLSPSHFHRFPVSEKVIHFMIELAKNNIE